VQYATSVT